MELRLRLNTFRLSLLLIYVKETTSKFSIASTQWSDLYSPNYPNKYPNNAYEIYELLARDYNNVVCVKAVTFDLEDTEGCTRDYLTVQNSLTSQPMGNWCGGHMPYVCTEKGVMYLRFRSDHNNVTGYGFHIMYREEVREESVPVMMIIGMSVAPFTILVILVCFCLGRRKKRFNTPIDMEAVDNRGSSTQTPSNESSCNVASISLPPGYNVNHLGPPSYESAVTNEISDLPPSYDSLVEQGIKRNEYGNNVNLI